MDDLVKRIQASLENQNNEPWFPELTSDLAAWAWDRLRRDIGLVPDTYGTERVVSHNISARREIIKSLTTTQCIGSAPAISIEALSEECAVKYQKKGISFYTPDEILNTTVLACIEDSLLIFNEVPSLMSTVAALVRSLHVIKPEHADYDVSFSEPDVPLSIFVSVPRKPTTNDAVRVAEAILHEAMHLQLTLIECVSPLVNSTAPNYFSPWRGEHRTAGGILHGLYVFYVIHCFLDRLVSIGSCTEHWLQYVRLRQREIAIQLDEIRYLPDCPGWTAVGLILVRRCLQIRHSEQAISSH
jgi:hypothetical protein